MSNDIELPPCLPVTAGYLLMRVPLTLAKSVDAHF
jgi:hypothetical protein